MGGRASTKVMVIGPAGTGHWVFEQRSLLLL